MMIEHSGGVPRPTIQKNASNNVKVLMAPFFHGLSLHRTPFLTHSHKRGNIDNCTKAVRVKHHPLPMARIIGFTTAVMPAPSRQRIRLAAGHSPPPPSADTDQ
jgi:hypothetical protein